MFDRLIQRIGDGHVAIEWPRADVPAPIRSPSEPPDICEMAGFDPNRTGPGTARHLPGYRAMDGDDALPAGILPVGDRAVGVIRIGLFEPQGSPSLCRAALRALRIGVDRPCDDTCHDAILTWAYDRLTAILEERVRAIRAAGATVLLVDVTNNGGGSEWAEAAARVLSPKPLTSERRGFVRGAHWAHHWKETARRLRQAAGVAVAEDRSRLLAWAAEAEAARKDAGRGCAGAGPCDLIGRAGFATGLVGAARSGEFAGKPWAELVFDLAQFPYHDSLWSGPLIVLVDDETWSAAEEFAAVLQDNRAAVIVGARTGGAGCGHTDGGTPTVLGNSRAILELPDCVRFRADGSNEVAGVIPDVLTGIRANDGPAFKAKRIAARLPAVVSLAIERSRE